MGVTNKLKLSLRLTRHKSKRKRSLSANPFPWHRFYSTSAGTEVLYYPPWGGVVWVCLIPADYFASEDSLFIQLETVLRWELSDEQALMRKGLSRRFLTLVPGGNATRDSRSV